MGLYFFPVVQRARLQTGYLGVFECKGCGKSQQAGGSITVHKEQLAVSRYLVSRISYLVSPRLRSFAHLDSSDERPWISETTAKVRQGKVNILFLFGRLEFGLDAKVGPLAAAALIYTYAYTYIYISSVIHRCIHHC